MSSDFVKAYDVRGLVPDQLNVDVAWALGAAFAQTVVAPEGASGVVIGHDMRPSLAGAVPRLRGRGHGPRASTPP